MFLLYYPKGYCVNGNKFEDVALNVQTYDVLLRKYDTYLDNVVIPGYWNHAAICSVGAGAYSKVLHSTSDGVHEDSLFDFMKTDHVCLLRPVFRFDTDRMRSDIREICGKPYDFDFNFGDPSRFSCTEVINYLFRGFDNGIKEEKFLGNLIVPPDNIYNSKGFKKIIPR